MLHRTEAHIMSPAERRREVAAILARGVVRLRRRNPTDGLTHAPESSPNPEKSLELPAETRLSGSHGTRGLRLRDEGDDA